MKCNWRGRDITGWKIENCSSPVAAKCKVCGNFTCADHKSRFGPISPGITVDICSSCHTFIVRAGGRSSSYRYVDTDNAKPFKANLKVKNNLCCVLNGQWPCKCGNITCIHCIENKIKPHDECEYIYHRKLLAWAQKQI